jgi:hypothetical protein
VYIGIATQDGKECEEKKRKKSERRILLQAKESQMGWNVYSILSEASRKGAC